MPEELIFYGSAVKALGDGRVGGYLVEFTDYEAQKGTPPDLVKEFFTKSTDYDIEPGEKRSVYFDHGQDPVMKRRRLGKAELKTDDVGLWAETILDTRDKYLAKIYELAEQGKLGWSSGSAPHLVEKAKKSDGFVEITAWPIAEASLTHRPCNPFSAAIPLKAFVEELAEMKGEKPAANNVKGLFQEKLSEQTPSVWTLESALRDVERDIAKANAASNVTGVSVDVESLVRAAGAEFVDARTPLVVAQILAWDGEGEFYLKSVFDEFIASGSELVSGSDLEGHSQAVVSAVAEFAQKAGALSEPLKAWVERLERKQEFRANDPVKAGRVISQANRDRIAEVMGMLKELMPVLEQMHGSLSDLHTMAEPKKSADPDMVRGLLANFEFMQRRTSAARSS